MDGDGQIYEASDEDDPFCTTDHLEGFMVHPVEAGLHQYMQALRPWRAERPVEAPYP